jgi:hypothetical protein
MRGQGGPVVDVGEGNSGSCFPLRETTASSSNVPAHGIETALAARGVGDPGAFAGVGLTGGRAKHYDARRKNGRLSEAPSQADYSQWVTKIFVCGAAGSAS